MGTMNHAEWIECVEKACGMVEMLGGDTRRVRLCRRTLCTRPVSVLGRTLGYGLWKAMGDV